MKVENMLSDRGNKIANQFIIEDNNGNDWFQSYKSIIVLINSEGQVYLDEYYWDYSRTTSKYRNIFLNESTKETQKKITKGQYKLVDLNSMINGNVLGEHHLIKGVK